MSSYSTVNQYSTMEQILKQIFKLRLYDTEHGTTLGWHYFAIPCPDLCVPNLPEYHDIFNDDLYKYINKKQVYTY